MKPNLPEFFIRCLPNMKSLNKNNLNINLKKGRKAKLLQKGKNLLKNKKELPLFNKLLNSQGWTWGSQDKMMANLTRMSLLKMFPTS